jgi:hypothetical protein
MGFVIAAVVVGYVAVLFGWFSFAASRNFGFAPAFAPAAVWLMLGLGLVIQAGINEDRKGPCLQHETTMQFNAATKTMMPARHCVLRGEWVE